MNRIEHLSKNCFSASLQGIVLFSLITAVMSGILNENLFCSPVIAYAFILPASFVTALVYKIYSNSQKISLVRSETPKKGTTIAKRDVKKNANSPAVKSVSQRRDKSAPSPSFFKSLISKMSCRRELRFESESSQKAQLDLLRKNFRTLPWANPQFGDSRTSPFDVNRDLRLESYIDPKGGEKVRTITVIHRERSGAAVGMLLWHAGYRLSFDRSTFCLIMTIIPSSISGYPKGTHIVHNIKDPRNPTKNYSLVDLRKRGVRRVLLEDTWEQRILVSELYENGRITRFQLKEDMLIQLPSCSLEMVKLIVFDDLARWTAGSIDFFATTVFYTTNPACIIVEAESKNGIEQRWFISSPFMDEPFSSSGGLPPLREDFAKCRSLSEGQFISSGAYRITYKYQIDTISGCKPEQFSIIEVFTDILQQWFNLTHSSMPGQSNPYEIICHYLGMTRKRKP